MSAVISLGSLDLSHFLVLFVLLIRATYFTYFCLNYFQKLEVRQSVSGGEGHEKGEGLGVRPSSPWGAVGPSQDCTVPLCAASQGRHSRQNKHQRATPYGKRKCAPRFGGPLICSGHGRPFPSLLSLAENPSAAPTALWAALRTLPTLRY